MARDNDAIDVEQIETTLAFDVNIYEDYDPFERVAEAVIESGNRRVDYLYDISHEGDEDELQVHSRYYLGGELRNESNAQQTYPTDGKRVYHTETGQELREFIEANAFADPEISLTDEFEGMVDV